MNWLKRNQKIKSEEFSELEKAISSLKLKVTDLELELALILKKLKFKYKITKRDLKEDDTDSEDLSSSILLPDNG